ncbi:hypothetical protein [uncultured Prevotella sp.]|uniref:hypothetical protein n=1 Tax=uncultured Prevotella sp. TaxID=159272 RepID=UPI002589D0FD|nr:hypothetical protein [uncultured Prevotella sp.]
MKRVCYRPIQIDALTICYEVVHPYYYKQLTTLNYGECLDMDEFRLYRIEGRYFDNVYAIRLWNGTRDIEWGTLKFNLARGDEQSNTHTSGNRKVWFSLNNETLYSDDWHYQTYIEQRLGMQFHNVTSLDLALDTPFSVSPLVKAYLHNKDVTTILNGKRITDRDEDRPEISYTFSGSLNKQDKYKTVNIKQRNALKDKSKGITVLTYDKVAEISNASDKQYILDYYGNPKRLYRTEVHLNAEDIKNYVEHRGIQYTPLILVDEAILEDMFFHFLGSVIRFQSRKVDASWEHLLGRS